MQTQRTLSRKGFAMVIVALATVAVTLTPRGAEAYTRYATWGSRGTVQVPKTVAYNVCIQRAQNGSCVTWVPGFEAPTRYIGEARGYEAYQQQVCVTYWFGYSVDRLSWKQAASQTKCSTIAASATGAYVQGSWVDLWDFAIKTGVTRAYWDSFAIEVRWRLSNGTLIGQEASTLVHTTDYACNGVISGMYMATGVCGVVSNAVGTDAGVYIAIT